MYQRSLACDLEWPRYSSVSREERELGLAYVITAFSDPRNLELSLATIFRPHNSYCVHIDTKSDPVFRESVENMLGCYRQRHPGRACNEGYPKVPKDFTITENAPTRAFFWLKAATII